MMTRIGKIFLIAALCVASVPALAVSPATVSVADCWIRALPGELPSAGYFKVTNNGDQVLNLVAVEADAFGMAMLHQTQSQGSMSKMVMAGQVPVPAHGTLIFAPGNYHVMLEQPKKPLTIGASIPMSFAFSDGQKVIATCAVKSAATAAN